MARFILTLVMAFLCTACALQSPQNLLEQEPLNTPDHWVAQTEQIYVKGSAPFVASLQALYQSPALKDAVAKALNNNPNLKNLALQVSASGHLLQQVNSTRLPTVDVQAGYSRSNELGDINKSYEFGLNVSWEIDMWGRLANLHSAAESQYESMQAQLESARSLVATEVIRLWIETWVINRILELEQQHLAYLEKTKDIIIDNYRKGLAGLEDLSLIRVDQQQAKATIEAKMLSYQQVTNKLKLLLGELPNNNHFFTELPHISLPPLQVPATVLSQRPDIQAALYQLQASVASAHAAQKALLPTLTLTGTAIKRHQDLNQLSQTDPLWNLLGGISQPVFMGGKLKAERDAAYDQAQAQWWDYKQTLLNAIYEVENALAMENALTQQLRTITMAMTESEQYLQLSEQRYRKGLIDILAFIQAQEKHLQVKAKHLELQAALMDNRILLAQALGYRVQQ